MDPSSAIKVICLANSIVNYVESESLLENFVGDVSLNAARSSLRKARLSVKAESYESLVWNAVGHLETSLQSYERILFSGAGFFPEMKAVSRHIAKAKLHYVNCLAAICYAYLGEPTICFEHIEKEFNFLEWYWVTGREEKRRNMTYASITGKGKDPFFDYFDNILNMPTPRIDKGMELSYKNLSSRNSPSGEGLYFRMFSQFCVKSVLSEKPTGALIALAKFRLNVLETAFEREKM